MCNIVDGWSRVWCNPHRIIVHFGVTIYLNYLQLKTFTHNQTKTWTLDYTVACLLRAGFIKIAHKENLLAGGRGGLTNKIAMRVSSLSER